MQTITQEEIQFASDDEAPTISYLILLFHDMQLEGRGLFTATMGEC